MAKVVEVTVGMDAAEYNEVTAAERIGGRLRKIREEKGLSQSELGERVGLTADRIQKYENGIRQPRIGVLKDLANALGVNTLAIADPVLTSDIGAMYGLFELENVHNLSPVTIDGHVYLSFGDEFSGLLKDSISQWAERKAKLVSESSTASSEEQAELLKDYHLWEWTYPESLNVDSQRLRRIDREIKRLQEEKEAILKRRDGS